MDRLDTLRLFCEIAATGSFARAAERLNLPRATATYGIQALERRLGARLFERTTRKVTLTPEGEQYLERSRRLLMDFDEADALFSGKRPAGVVRIDLPERFANHTLIPLLPEFFAQFPDIHLRLGTTGRYVDLVGEGVDCALRVGTLADSSLAYRALGRLEQINCAAPAYLDRHGTPATPADLPGHFAVGYFSSRLGRDMDWEWEADGKTRTLRLPSRVSVGSSEAYTASAVAGLGLVQIPRMGVAAHLARGDLREILPAWRPAVLPVSLVFPQRQAMPPRVRAFVDWACAVLPPRLA